MKSITVEYDCHFVRGRHGRRNLRQGEAPDHRAPVGPGRVPRIAKLMALAVRFEEKLEAGHVRDMAELARLGFVTRARLTQIMNLRLLAPEIQEDLLNLPRVLAGRAPIKYRDLIPIIRCLDWEGQRERWNELLKYTGARMRG